MAGVEIVPARADQRPALEAMFQLYVHDFSAFWAGRPDGELEEDGRFGPYEHLGSYWREPDRRPLLIRAEGRLAGFALINAHSHMRRLVDHAVAEFFVVRKHRRAGVGAAAARAIFSAQSGTWEAAVARANTGALAFWREAIGGHPGLRDLEVFDRDDADWNGAVLRFEIRP
jgi:predicted acetyltransferase